MITFGELKRLTKDILVPKKQLLDDYILSYDEITDGSIFSLYKENKNPLLSINGIQLCKKEKYTIDDVSVFYQTINNVRIEPEELFFKPIGGNIKLNSIASFTIHRHSTFGDVDMKTIEGNIKPIYHIDNKDFTINKDILSVGENSANEERTTEISITYSYGRINKDAKYVIKQLPNTISDWVLEKIVDNKITLSPSIEKIPRNGEICDLRVIKESTKYYYKEDANGHKLMQNKEEICHEDVTSLCRFSALDLSFIKIIGNHVIFEKQTDGNEPRYATICAEFGVLSDSKTLYQEGGGVVTYDYQMTFLGDNSTTRDEELPTSLPCDGYVPFSAIKMKYVDGKPIEKILIPLHNIQFMVSSDILQGTVPTVHNDWCSCDIVEDSMGQYQLHFEVYEKNPSKTQYRKYSAILFCEREMLIFNITQPCLRVVNTSLEIEISGETQYNKENIKKAYIDFIPYKTTTYEDNSVERKICIDDDKMIDYECITTNQEIFLPKRLYKSDFNGIHTLIFTVNQDRLDEGDIDLKISGSIYSKEGKWICSSNSLSVHYHNQIVLTEYEFNTKDTTEYIWKPDWTDEITININSILKTTIDNNTTIEKIPFEIISTDSNLGHFNIFIKEEGLVISPKEINSLKEDITAKFFIYQQNTNDKIEFTLTHLKHEDEDVIVKLSVIAHADDVLDEIWSSESLLFISSNDKTIYTINMSPCWLYEGNTEDIIYQGYVALKADNTYTLKTKGFKVLDEKHSATDYNINEELNLTKEDTEITLYIDL